MAFADVLGHDRVRDLLGRALVAGRLPPALLFVGPRGVGKRTLALAVARALLCPDGASLGDACGKCPACHRTCEGAPSRPHPGGAGGATLTSRSSRCATSCARSSPALRGARARGRDRRRAHHDRAGPERAAQEPRGAAPDLARAPGDAVAAGPAADDPLALPDPAPRPAAGGPARGDLSERLALSPAEARLRASVSAGSLGQALAFEADAYGALRDELLR